jgi:Xaa-Pro aminopeptidase
MGTSLYTKRWRKIKAYLRKKKVDAFIFKMPINIRYLFSSHLPHTSSLAMFLVILRSGRTIAVTSSLEAYRTEVHGAKDADLHIFSSLPHVKKHSKTFTKALAQVLKEAKVKKALCDGPMKIRGVKIAPDDLLVEMRKIKDPAEVRLIRRACRITDKAAAKLPYLCKPGVTEREVHRELNYIMKREGADSLGFETMVASGPHSAYPHHDLTDRKFKKGDPVTCDFGAIYNGYTADLTRTHFVGRPNKELRDIYNAVYESQKAGIKAVKSGVMLGTVDKACRDVIVEYGYGEYYVHSTGHGIGLEVHEMPMVIPGRKERIRKGMVFTVEPGVYIPKKGGVRIEDDVYVSGSNRKEVLTKARIPKY